MDVMENLVMERRIWIAAPQERVWGAVTEPEQLAQWFLPPALGAQMKRDGSGKIFVSMMGMDVPVAVLEAAEPPRRATTRTAPDGLTTNTFTLEAQKGGTQVTVTMNGRGIRPGDESEEQAEPSGAAWEKALANLKAYVEGEELPFPEGYVAALFGYRREGKRTFGVERSIWIAASRERVWQAITDPEQIEHWFSPGTKWHGSGPEVGGSFSVYNPETESEMYTQVIEVVEPPHHFVTRTPPEPSGLSYVTDWKLEEEKGGTRLLLNYYGYELEAAETRHTSAEQNAFGFGMMLENVQAYVEGQPLPYPQGF
jgi:uncharacterized protein YndB with AHSA1/START domain